jgi:hypothetical protein
MTPDLIVVMTGPPAVLGIIWIAAIVRAAERAARQADPEAPAPYVPPPLTSEYVDQEFPVLMWHLTHPELNP